MNNLYLQHHGILGQHWGIRRYQNPDGTLTEAGRKRLEKKDQKWSDRNYDKIYNKVYKKSKKELNNYIKNEFTPKYKNYISAGKTTSGMLNDYNRKLAEIMNKNVGDLKAPSGRAVQYVAKRGEQGVHMALVPSNYDMSKVKNGIWGDGRVAYKKNKIQIGV